MDEENENRDNSVTGDEDRSLSEDPDSGAVVENVVADDTDDAFEEQIRKIATYEDLDKFLQEVDADRLGRFRRENVEPSFLHIIVDILPKQENATAIYRPGHSKIEEQLAYYIAVHTGREDYWVTHVSDVLQRHKEKLQPLLNAQQVSNYERNYVAGKTYINALSHATKRQEFRIAKVLLNLGVTFQKEALAFISNFVTHFAEEEKHVMDLISLVLPGDDKVPDYRHLLVQKASMRGETEDYPLLRAVSKPKINIRLIKAFLENGAKVSHENRYGNFFHSFVTHAPDTESLKELIEKKTSYDDLKKSINAVNVDGVSVIQAVVAFSSLEFAEKFIKDFGMYLQLNQRINLDHIIKDNPFIKGSIFHVFIDRLRFLD